MRKGVFVLIALLFPGAAAALENAAPAARDEIQHATPAAPLRLPPRETFRLFPQIAPEPRVGLAGLAEGPRLLHQAGDPDSLFTFGAPTPGGEVHVNAAIEVNEIHLKAIPPDPGVSPNDTRPRAAGSFLPLDNQGRPYQLRLGARLVW
jgi:hypothetical protein